MLDCERSPWPMSRQQLQALLALAEQEPDLRRPLRLQGSWEHWLEKVQALGFQITAADLQQAHDEDQAQRFFDSSQLPTIRPLH